MQIGNRGLNNKLKNSDYSDDLKSLLYLLEFKTAWLLEKHELNNIDDIEGIGLQIIAKCTKALKTLSTVCTICKDYSVANTTLRMIIDSIAIYNIVYAIPDKEEREYRHYLYIKDGIKSRLSTMEDELEYTGGISVEEFVRLQKRYKDTKTSDLSAIQHCNDILNKHSYSTLYSEFHKQTIEHCNWRYKDNIYKSKINQNRYSWEELYVLLDPRKEIYTFISTHLTQFSHGFCVSNIVIEETSSDFNPILSFGIVAAGILQKFLKAMYPDDDSCYRAFLKSPHFKRFKINIDKKLI